MTRPCIHVLSRVAAIPLAAVALAAAVPVARADDDRAATVEEEKMVRVELESKGYRDVRDIEVDDGRFEVDAISPAMQSVDLELDMQTLEILHEKHD
jgi:hypothetical protein